MTPTPDTTDSELEKILDDLHNQMCGWYRDKDYANSPSFELPRAKATLLAWRDAYTAQRVAEARRDELENHVANWLCINNETFDAIRERLAQISQLEGKEQR